MAVTRLKRKELRNRVKAKKRVEGIKKLLHLPPVKKVDVEKIKEEFAQKSGTKAKKKEDASAKAKKENTDTTAVEKEPAKAKADARKEDTTAVEKEPAKTQVKDTPVAEESEKDKGASEENA